MTNEVERPRGAELARQAFNHIVKNPHEWKQDGWCCGTKHCFGGWCVVIGTGMPYDCCVESIASLLGFDDTYHWDFEMSGVTYQPFSCVNTLADIREFVVALMARDGNINELLPVP